VRLWEVSIGEKPYPRQYTVMWDPAVLFPAFQLHPIRHMLLQSRIIVLSNRHTDRRIHIVPDLLNQLIKLHLQLIRLLLFLSLLLLQLDLLFQLSRRILLRLLLKPNLFLDTVDLTPDLSGCVLGLPVSLPGLYNLVYEFDGGIAFTLAFADFLGVAAAGLDEVLLWVEKLENRSVY
jgi:hypothetical protein